MTESYDTIMEPAGGEFTEKRSRFIGAVVPAQSEESARAALAEIRSANKDASHNCHAFVLRSGIARYSDDGEPQGAAGIPILEVIKREVLVDVIVVVTRYFGGTLLGAGGLIRAYARAAKLALDSGRRVTMCLCSLFMLECPYHLYERVRLLLENHGALIINADFGREVVFEARIRSDSVPGLKTALRDLSSNQIEIVLLGEEFSAAQGFRTLP